jgi:hypothetical protein
VKTLEKEYEKVSKKEKKEKSLVKTLDTKYETLQTSDKKEEGMLSNMEAEIAKMMAG